MKVGDIVRDYKTKQLGIIVAPYEGSSWDWEVHSIKNPFGWGHTWQDCFKELDLVLYDWKDYPQIPESFFARVKFALRIILIKDFAVSLEGGKNDK